MLTAATDLKEKALREKIVKSLGQLPPFSPVLNKLLASLAREDVSFAELGGLIEKDTVMSGNVLRLVNSAAYARRGEINSIPHAISVLGINKLRNLVLGLSISRMWAGVKMPPSWSHARFNLHSVGTAILADQLAQNLSVNYPEGAFVSGLFHDFGKMLIAIAFPAEYREVEEMFQLGGRSAWECEREILGVDHAAIAGLALVEWNLPVPIRRAVEFHHCPDQNSNADAERGGESFHLSQVVRVASDVLNLLGHPVAAANAESGPASPEDAFAPLVPFALADPDKTQSAFQQEFDTIRSFF